MSSIILRACKFDRAPHLEWRGEVLGRSRTSVACLARPGTRCVHHGRGIEFVLEHYALSLFRPGDWFNTMLDFDAAGRPLMIYCNVALPYADDGASLTWIDLDLDVVLSPGAAAELVDRDEFEANAVHYGYPRPVVERARTMADELLSLAQAGREPFRWDPLGRVLERLDVQRPSA